MMVLKYRCGLFFFFLLVSLQNMSLPESCGDESTPPPPSPGLIILSLSPPSRPPPPQSLVPSALLSLLPSLPPLMDF